MGTISKGGDIFSFTPLEAQRRLKAVVTVSETPVVAWIPLTRSHLPAQASIPLAAQPSESNGVHGDRERGDHVAPAYLQQPLLPEAERERQHGHEVPVRPVLGVDVLEETCEQRNVQSSTPRIPTTGTARPQSFGVF